MNLAVDAEQVACVDFVGYIVEVGGLTIGNDDVGLLLELGQVVNDFGPEEFGLLEHGFINDDLDAFSFEPFHHALHAAGPEVVAARFHDETVDTDLLGCQFLRARFPG